MKLIAQFPSTSCRRGLLSPLLHSHSHRHSHRRRHRRRFPGVASSLFHDGRAWRDARNDREVELNQEQKNEGAMSRRLSQMTESSIEDGGLRTVKAVEEAGFDNELQQQLIERLEAADFRSKNAGALSQASMPSSAGKGTRDNAAARPWTGDEALEDAALRMLDDAHKPIRMKPRIQNAQRPPQRVDTGRPSKPASSGSRLAAARERTSMYAFLKEDSMPDKERERIRKELKERFSPASRQLPATLQGLASLANERIEDAIARGQFKNLPRGKKIERDHNMSSPFLDTTEYFMNKIIQKQDIVPPWIEKQQELVSTAATFRGRLRADWKRHAARVIASQGGSLDAQIRRAENYAAAEANLNPSKQVERLDAVDREGHRSQTTIAGELRASNLPARTDEAVANGKSVSDIPQEDRAATDVEQREVDDGVGPTSRPTTTVFRDLEWLETERAYHTLAIEDLNTKTRSYNLMAPDLAKKPYFSLERELNSCFADVAAQLPEEIRERARAPALKVEVIGHREGSVLEKLGGQTVKVHDERKPQYGFKEFWRDLFAS